MGTCFNLVDRKIPESLVALFLAIDHVVKQVRVPAAEAQLGGRRDLAPFAQEGEPLIVLVGEAADVEVVGTHGECDTVVRAGFLDHDSQPDVWCGSQLLLPEDQVVVVDPLAGRAADVEVELVQECFDSTPSALARSNVTSYEGLHTCTAQAQATESGGDIS